jgi:hypothetical protein
MQHAYQQLNPANSTTGNAEPRTRFRFLPSYHGPLAHPYENGTLVLPIKPQSLKELMFENLSLPR